MKKEYAVENFDQHWQEIADFVFARANIVRLTRTSWREIGFFYIRKKGEDNDPEMVRVLKSLENDFIKKEVNNLKYNDMPQAKISHFEHRFYRLSENIKARLVKVKLNVHGYQEHFYGFEDATFYQENEMICSIISHENTAILFLTENEVEELRSKSTSLQPIDK